MNKKSTYKTAKSIAILAESFGWTLIVGGTIIGVKTYKPGTEVALVIIIAASAVIGFGMIVSAQIIKAQVHTAENTARTAEILEVWLSKSTIPNLGTDDQKKDTAMSVKPSQRVEPSLRR